MQQTSETQSMVLENAQAMEEMKSQFQKLTAQMEMVQLSYPVSKNADGQSCYHDGKTLPKCNINEIIE
jgi:hypothetical protein